MDYSILDLRTFFTPSEAAMAWCDITTVTVDNQHNFQHVLHEISEAIRAGQLAADNIRRGFRMVLADYPIDKIREAFNFHLKNSRDFPVPADIAVIIDRGNKPPFSTPVYIAINQKLKDERTTEEWKYIAEYESFMRCGKY